MEHSQNSTMQECPKLCPSFIACFIHSIQGSLVMGRDLKDPLAQFSLSETLLEIEILHC